VDRGIIAARAKENLKTHTEEGYQGCQNSDKAVIDTKKELAKIAGTSHDTFSRSPALMDQGISPRS